MLGVGTSRSFAQAPDSFIQDIQVNENGSDIEGWNLTGTLPGNVAPSSSIDTPTGLGTITITYNPGAAGNYYIDTLIDEEVGTPFFNEYTSTSGTAPLGESWETGYISDATGTGPIYTDASRTTGDGLSGANNADGNTSSYPLNCTNNPSLGTVCNGDAVVALGEDFSLDATSYETITITVSDSAPSQRLRHPADQSQRSGRRRRRCRMCTSPRLRCRPRSARAMLAMFRRRFRSPARGFCWLLAFWEWG